MELSPAALEQVVIQLQSSGIQFSVKFIGSVRFETSINLIPTKSQSDVALSGIRVVARKANLKMLANDDDLFVEHFTASSINIYNDYVDLNVSSSAILIVDNSMNILHRFEISSISLVSEGKNDMSSFFCFFAKACVNGENERRCFVFDSDNCLEEIREVIWYALEVNEVNIFERNYIKVKETEVHKNDICDRPLIPEYNSPTLLHHLSQNSVELSTSRESNKQNLSRDIQNKHLNISEEPFRQKRLYSTSTNNNENYSVDISEERLEEIMSDLERQKWYHGRMTRSDAELLIQKKGQFLVRQSIHLKNQFVLSAFDEDEIKHVCLVNDDGTLDQFSMKFKTIVGLISYCRDNQVLLPKYGVRISLDYPIESKGFVIS